jgi:putative SOS response-associated peptidase YedK
MQVQENLFRGAMQIVIQKQLRIRFLRRKNFKIKKMDTSSIIIAKANCLMEQIHNKMKRMPTILDEAQASEWLKPDLSDSRI